MAERAPGGLSEDAIRELVAVRNTQLADAAGLRTSASGIRSIGHDLNSQVLGTTETADQDKALLIASMVLAGLASYLRLSANIEEFFTRNDIAIVSQQLVDADHIGDPGSIAALTEARQLLAVSPELAFDAVVRFEGEWH